MQIITGSTNFDNVTSNADASKHLGFIGADAVALNIGRKLEAAVGQTNNEVRIYDGEGFAQGIHFRVNPGTYDSVAIENGESGVKRTDLIVCRYRIDDNGYESTTWHTIKGAAGGAEPTYQQGSIRDESAEVIDVPFFKVELDGLSITNVTPLYSVLITMDEIQKALKGEGESVTAQGTTVAFTDSKDPTQFKTWNLKLEKKNGYVYANYVGIHNMRAKEKVSFSGTIPKAYRPAADVGISITTISKSVATGHARYVFTSAGKCFYEGNVTGTQEIYISAVWPAKEV